MEMRLNNYTFNRDKKNKYQSRFIEISFAILYQEYTPTMFSSKEKTLITSFVYLKYRFFFSSFHILKLKIE